MEKNKVDSRTELANFIALRLPDSRELYRGDRAELAKLIAELLERARPSVPAQGQGDVDEIVTRLYRRFKDWSKRGFGPEDVTWCEVKADIVSMVSALAASRSEVATPQAPQCISTNCPVWEFTHDIDAKGCISYRPGAPAAGLMPSCTVCGEIMQGVCKCGSKTGAAGSTERWDDVARVGRQMANMMFNLSQLRERVLNETDRLKILALQREWDEMLSRAALAQTDTDVPKEKL